MSYEIQLGGTTGSSRVAAALTLLASNWRITTQFSRQGFHPDAGVTHRYRVLTEPEDRMHTAAVNYLSRNFKRLAKTMRMLESLTQEEAEDACFVDFIFGAQEFINRCRVATAEIDVGEDVMFGAQEVPPFHEARVLTPDEHMCYDSAVDMLVAMFEYRTDTEQSFMTGLVEEYDNDS